VKGEDTIEGGGTIKRIGEIEAETRENTSVAEE